jgi:hypothetical protein
MPKKSGFIWSAESCFDRKAGMAILHVVFAGSFRGSLGVILVFVSHAAADYTATRLAALQAQ